jgi:hypothetical protein
MQPGPDAQRARAQLMVWWIIWAGILFGLVAIYLALGRGPVKPLAPGESPLVGLAGLPALFISIIIRWLVLPRMNSLTQALPLFVIGLALAEACGLLGIFLGGVYRDDLVLLGVLGIGQFMPFFARQLAEPKPRGYIPNN